jgi:uncharacterized membrane protein YvbJ
MALLNCPECSREVSSSATTCPQCGFPVANMNVESNKDKVQLVEQTSKNIKLQAALAFLVILLSIPILYFGLDRNMEVVKILGFIILGAGFLWFAYAAVMQWWHHG